MINRQFFEEMNEPFVKKGNMEINREHFEFWLFSQHADRQFDFNDVFECPLCCFLREVEGRIGPAVGNSNFYPDGLGDGPSSKRVPMPKWLDASDVNDYANAVLRATPCTIANMQSRYIALFGDPRETETVERSEHERTH